MKYIEHLVIYSIKYPFAKDNMDAVIIFLVNKYKYLLKNMINSIPVSVDKSTMNFKGKPYEPIIDMIDNILYCILCPYEINRSRL